MNDMQDAEPEDRHFNLEWATLAAFVLVLVVTASRMLTPEALRELTTFDGVAGADLPPSPGPASTLWLNLICWLPMLLILIRRAVDPQYVLRLHVSHAIGGLLAAWVAISCFWASDKFAAVVSASTWCASMSLAWSMSQLVRSWTRLRLVAGFAVGLLLVFLVQAALYHFFEWPDLQRNWEVLKQSMLAANPNTDPWLLRQLEQNVNSGAPLAFFMSANTFAAITALVAIVATGLGLQRWKDGDDSGFVAAVLAPAICSLGILWITDSRTAIAGFCLCLILLAAYHFAGDFFARHRTKLFWAGCALVLCGVVGLIAVGVATGGLLHPSMTFRWNYWQGAASLLAQRPLLGTGWANFGSGYLPHRLPVSAEEIKDPHNFLLTFATQAGVIGAALAVVFWGRSAWEATRTVHPAESMAANRNALPLILASAAAIVVFRAVAAGLHERTSDDMLIELMKTVLYAALVALGLLLGGVRASMTADTRAAPWVLGAIVIALGGFLLHSMVDFAMFETGPMLMMMVLLGSVLGVRHSGVSGRRARTPVALGALALLFISLVAYAALLAIPMTLAESHAAEARSLAERKLVDRAIAEYRAAFDAAPVRNHHYAALAADLADARGAAPAERVALRSLAISADPAAHSGWLYRARLGRALNSPTLLSEQSIFTDYTQALTRDPNNVRLRVEAGEYFQSTNRQAEAVEQYRIALSINDQFDVNEPRRLPAAVVERLKQAVP
ncbi:MAG TPA: O-antigen ligase family protein [Tepidisphaeraceae bacterium]|jgi:O-antigen ligase